MDNVDLTYYSGITIKDSHGITVGPVSAHNLQNSRSVNVVSSLPKFDSNRMHNNETNVTGDREIQQKDIRLISKMIGRDWKNLARHLPGIQFNEKKLDRHEQTYIHEGLQEVAVRFLREWNESCPSYNQLKVLQDTLREIDRSDIAMKLDL
ncbi:uncharacterized protein LOC111086407 [Limulus polyphemus]|uniref:Uncharacterized protein LOC111086407 n=1 Tax=Limulus polyphemus TaxID=6850 RepID=A0ABM1SMF5_LIMPO|nr:uncharacterized protein LOC111086407 [Limulus polyphemus]